MSTIEENKAIMRSYLEGFWSGKDPSIADRIVAQDAVFHDLIEQKMPPGLNGVKQNYRSFRAAFPDFKFDIQDIVAEGDKVVVRWDAGGTHRGTFQGIPATNKYGGVSGISIVRIRDGKIIEGWQELDSLGLMQGLGVLPSGPPPRFLVLLMTLRTKLSGLRQKKQTA
jgi:steroid delta-isomerase-like uncharacterized protein